MSMPKYIPRTDIYMNFRFPIIFLFAFSPAVSYSETLCGGKEPTVFVSKGVIVGGSFNGREFKGSLKGTRGKDVIQGTDKSDTINGSGGDDIICGGGGDDMIFGGRGEDVLYGGAGNDSLRGEKEDDRLLGGEGNDAIFGRKDKDNCEGELIASCEEGASNTESNTPLGLIMGPPDGLAYLYLSEEAIEVPSEIRSKTLSDDSTVFATRVTGLINRTATVSEVNAALTAHNSTIVSSIVNTSTVSILIPEKNTMAELKEFMASLETTGVFNAVVIGFGPTIL